MVSLTVGPAGRSAVAPEAHAVSIDSAIMVEHRNRRAGMARPANAPGGPAQAGTRHPAQGSALAERLLEAATLHDLETGLHLRRIGLYAQLLARAHDCPPGQVALIGQAARLHDIGKLGVPSEIFRKAGRLSEKEWLSMRLHAQIGHQMLGWSADPVMRLAAEIALTHHERWDGSGYPRGTSDQAIPLAGRIVGLVDTYDALRMPRAYKAGYDHARAMRIILEGDGRTEPDHFDPVLLCLFERLQQRFRTVYENFAD